jgi:hypothetical protein
MRNNLIPLIVAAMVGLVGYCVGLSYNDNQTTNELQLANIKALSSNEMLFGDVCFMVYTEVESVFDAGIEIYACSPCGQIKWVSHASLTGQC